MKLKIILDINKNHTPTITCQCCVEVIKLYDIVFSFCSSYKLSRIIFIIKHKLLYTIMCQTQFRRVDFGVETNTRHGGK